MRDAQKDKDTYYRMLGKQMRLNRNVHPWKWEKGTDAEEACVDLTRRYPTLFRSRAAMMNHLFLCIGTGIRWSKDGRMVWSKSGKLQTTRDYACSTFAHEREALWLWYPGGPRHSPIFHIPENATEDWLFLAMDFISRFLRIRPKTFAMGVKADLVSHYGEDNAYAKEEAVRRIATLKTLQAELTAYVKAQGWLFLIPKRLTKQQKAAQAELADQIISEILQEEAAAK